MSGFKIAIYTAIGVSIVFLLMLSIMGCASVDKNVAKEINPYLGRNISEVIADYGPPTYEAPDGQGGKVYTWVRKRESSNPGYFIFTGRYSMYMPPTRSIDYAYQSFWVNEDGKVYRYEGKGL